VEVPHVGSEAEVEQAQFSKTEDVSKPCEISENSEMPIDIERQV